MSVATYSPTIFVALNLALAVACWPQLASIHRDPGRAVAVSLPTWLIFLAANAVIVIHALASLDSPVVAAVVGINALGCSAIVLYAAYKRYGYPVPADQGMGLRILWAARRMRTKLLRFFARWSAARYAARRQYVQDLGRKGLAAID